VLVIFRNDLMFGHSNLILASPELRLELMTSSWNKDYRKKSIEENIKARLKYRERGKARLKMNGSENSRDS